MDTVKNPQDVILIKDWVTIWAVILGPILAVFATRIVDHIREIKAARKSIFKTLMMTRLNKLSVDHIAALNAVEIEFYNCNEVMTAWRAYLENLSSDVNSMSEQTKSQHYSKRDRLFARLIAEIAKEMKLKFQQLDIIDANYFPQGWFDIENEQREIRQRLIALLRGNHCLPVTVEKSESIHDYFDELNKKYREGKKPK